MARSKASRGGGEREGDPPVREEHAEAEAECAEHQHPPPGGGPPVHRAALPLHRLPSATLRILASDGGTNPESSSQSSAPEQLSKDKRFPWVLAKHADLGRGGGGGRRQRRRRSPGR
jgi:hypothetical protein